jgi:hypothetical protein
MKKKYHTITDIVGTVYCERKVVFDRERGDARPLEVRAKAAAGTFEHLRFQVEGQTRAALDQRCFIATAIYGNDAPETHFLRAWRDRVLMPRTIGRLFVRAYYGVSPSLVPLLCRSRCAAKTLRAGLNALLAMLGMPR